MGGDGWIKAKVSSDTNIDIGKAAATTTVKVFLCENPWPVPEDFPYYDSATNCKAGTPVNQCLNKNFELYYCRDSGAAGLVDDLPPLYNPVVLGYNKPLIPGIVNSDNIMKEFIFRKGISIIDAQKNAKQTIKGNNTTESTNACIIDDSSESARTEVDGRQCNYKIRVPKNGNYYLILTTSNHNNTLRDAGLNLIHEINILVGDTVKDKVKAKASPPEDKQVNLANLGYLTAGNYLVGIDWLNDIVCLESYWNGDRCQGMPEPPIIDGERKFYDSNLKIYSLVLSDAANDDAIGVRVVTNYNHY